jgi:site-specific DNA-methyltransferase (adenine-specific)
LLGRHFLGIEQDESFIEMSRMRREELNLPQVAELYRSKIKDLNKIDLTTLTGLREEEHSYGDLPF